MDYLAALVAFQSYHGKRYAPMRRQCRDRLELYSGDYPPIMFGILTGVYSFNEGFALEAVLSGYEVPELIHHFMQFYRIHGPARYPAPNVMGDPYLDSIARNPDRILEEMLIEQGHYSGAWNYEPALEHYFSTGDFLNSSGGRVRQRGTG
ncbi:hypothetical protein BE20_07980 [Sorangium cellulosum]|nr:hypothetical protein BE20_07980 [Sorangium cellulosum]